MPAAITVRAMTNADLVAARPLLAQLGYALSPEEVASRFARVAAAPDHAVMVAQLDGRVVGLLHVFARPALEKPPEVIIQALVTDETLRRSGVGNILMDEAERWAVDRGFTSVSLSSNVVRDGAHAFYEARGYVRTATAHQFRRDL